MQSQRDCHAPVAQWIRAPDCGSGGQRFESSRAYNGRGVSLRGHPSSVSPPKDRSSTTSDPAELSSDSRRSRRPPSCSAPAEPSGRAYSGRGMLLWGHPSSVSPPGDEEFRSHSHSGTPKLLCLRRAEQPGVQRKRDAPLGASLFRFPARDRSFQADTALIPDPERGDRACTPSCTAGSRAQARCAPLARDQAWADSSVSL